MLFIGRFVIILVILTCSLTALAQDHDHSTMASAQSRTQKDPALPAAEDQAKAVLESSPRHGEFVPVPLRGSDVKINAWIVYPERSGKAGVVIIIHEIFGLSGWIRALADQVAKEGFIAVVPDLISGMGPGGGGTESLQSRDDVVKLIRGLTPEETTKRLNAVYSFASKIPSANGNIGTIGFCWGGSASYAYATAQQDLKAAVVFYGTSPDSAMLGMIRAPVLGLYGGDDERVDATIEPASKEMKRLGKSYDYEIYEGAGHGFLRQQSDRNGANMKATKKAWSRTVLFLKKNL